MSDLIGVTSFPFSGVLKHNALWFDKFTSPVLSSHLSVSGSRSSENAAVIEYLQGQGILINPSEKVLELIPRPVDQIFNLASEVVDRSPNKTRFFDILRQLGEKVGAENVYETITQKDLAIDEVREFWELVADEAKREKRHIARQTFGNYLPESARKLASVLRSQYDVQAFPLLVDEDMNMTRGEDIDNPINDVLHIVLTRIPFPDESVSWEQIIEYRQDPDSKRKVLALRNWMHEISRSDLSQHEIEERLDFLVAEYESHVKLHRMKYKHGVLETVVTAIPDLIQKLVWIRWGDAAKLLFDLRHKKIALLEGEAKSPGSEVAYLFSTNEKFGT